MSEIYRLPKERIELWGQIVAIGRSGLHGRPLSRPSYHHEVQFQGYRMLCIKLLKWPLRSRIAARIACVRGGMERWLSRTWWSEANSVGGMQRPAHPNPANTFMLSIPIPECGLNCSYRKYQRY